MDQVFITDLVARGIVGINDWEREKPRRFNSISSCLPTKEKRGRVMTSKIASTTAQPQKKSLPTPKRPTSSQWKHWQPTWRVYAWRRW